MRFWYRKISSVIWICTAESDGVKSVNINSNGYLAFIREFTVQLSEPTWLRSENLRLRVTPKVMRCKYALSYRIQFFETFMISCRRYLYFGFNLTFIYYSTQQHQSLKRDFSNRKQNYQKSFAEKNRISLKRPNLQGFSLTPLGEKVMPI